MEEQIYRIIGAFIIAFIICYGILSFICGLSVNWKVFFIVGCGLVVLAKDDKKNNSGYTKEEWIIGGDGKLKGRFNQQEYKEYKFVSRDRDKKLYMSEQGGILTTQCIDIADKKITPDGVVTVIAALAIAVFGVITIVQMF